LIADRYNRQPEVDSCWGKFVKREISCRRRSRIQGWRGVAGLAALLALGACENRTCLRGHAEAYQTTMPIIVGMNGGVPIYSSIPTTGTRQVCDEWKEPAQ
jgi:hypothetical protein